MSYSRTLNLQKHSSYKRYECQGFNAFVAIGITSCFYNCRNVDILFEDFDRRHAGVSLFGKSLSDSIGTWLEGVLHRGFLERQKKNPIHLCVFGE